MRVSEQYTTSTIITISTLVVVVVVVEVVVVVILHKSRFAFPKGIKKDRIE